MDTSLGMFPRTPLWERYQEMERETTGVFPLKWVVQDTALKNLLSYHENGKKINEKTTLIFLPPKPFSTYKKHKHNSHSLFIYISLWLHRNLNCEHWTTLTEFWELIPDTLALPLCCVHSVESTCNSGEKHCTFSFHPAIYASFMIQLLTYILIYSISKNIPYVKTYTPPVVFPKIRVSIHPQAHSHIPYIPVTCQNIIWGVYF